MNKTETVAAIAKKHLGLETLATQHSDELDFHDLAVWQIKIALDAAYNAGRADGTAATADVAADKLHADRTALKAAREALLAIAGWVSDEGPLTGKGPCSIADFARKAAR